MQIGHPNALNEFGAHLKLASGTCKDVVIPQTLNFNIILG